MSSRSRRSKFNRFLFCFCLFSPHSDCVDDKRRSQRRDESNNTALSNHTRREGINLQLVSCFLFPVAVLQLRCQTGVSGPGFRAPGPDRCPDPEEEDQQVAAASPVTSLSLLSPVGMLT